MNQSKKGLPQAFVAHPHQQDVMLQKMAVSSQMKDLPTSPPVYRPHPVQKVLQTKMSGEKQPPTSQLPRQPIAPPVFRPELKRAVQPKMAATAAAPKSPIAPPVYRPQAVPRVLQIKESQVSGISPSQKRRPPHNARTSVAGSFGGDTVQRTRVYRMGSSTDQNLCPRHPQDDDAASAGRGLSTSSAAPNGKAQIIETDNLGDTLEAVNDHGNHYAIRPTEDDDNAKLTAWAATRAAGGHASTAAVRGAIVATRAANGDETDV